MLRIFKIAMQRLKGRFRKDAGSGGAAPEKRPRKRQKKGKRGRSR